METLALLALASAQTYNSSHHLGSAAFLIDDESLAASDAFAAITLAGFGRAVVWTCVDAWSPLACCACSCGQGYVRASCHEMLSSVPLAVHLWTASWEPRATDHHYSTSFIYSN